MKVFLLVFSLLFSAASQAQAGIPVGYSEFTDPVMALPAGASEAVGEDVYLCHLVRKYHVAFLPVLYWSEGYVLGEQACTTDRYLAITPEQIGAMKVTGVLPEDLPDQPILTLAQRAPLMLELLFAAWVIVTLIRAGKRQKARFALMGPLHITSKRVLDTLCHAAHEAGFTDEDGTDFIARLTTKLTGQSVPTAMVAKVLAVTQSPKHADFPRFCKGMTADQRDTLMHAVLLVMASAPAASSSARRFVKELAAASKMTGQRLDGIAAKLAPVS